MIQENVWDYPRPPRLEAVSERIRVVCQGVEIANTQSAFRVLETSHPPVYYIPPSDIRNEYLVNSPRETFCEWKGRANYVHVRVNGHLIEHAGWLYNKPTPAFTAIAGYVAFYAGKMDACYVGDEQVTPQPGAFYGGWITSNLIGPFKG